MDFPSKAFEVPFKFDPRPDIYKQLTDCNANFPVSDLASSPTYLPDFTRAVALGGSVWRVNVPGYFFKCPGSSDGRMSTGAKSGIIIDRYNHRMNAVSNHSHTHTWTSSKKTEGSVSGSNTYKLDGYTDKDFHEDYVEKNLQLSINYEEKSSYGDYATRGKYVGGIEDNSKIYKPKDWSAFNPTVSVGGSICHVAILSNQREYPENMPDGSTLVRDLGCDYVVSSGINSCGGIANSIAPIIPGVATTNIPSRIEYEVGWDKSKGSTPAYWSISALSETTLATVTKILKMTNYHLATSDIVVTGIIEAKGTYVYAYKDSNCSDTYYFVPCRSVDQSVSPVTKIRDITNSYSCTPNLPTSDVTFSAYPSSSTMAHMDGKSTAAVWGKQQSGVGFTATIGSTTITYSGNVNCNPIMHAHPSAMDVAFRQIFVNPSITGHTAPFVAQVLNLPVWPGTCNNSVSDINGHATHTVFNPKS